MDEEQFAELLAALKQIATALEEIRQELKGIQSEMPTGSVYGMSEGKFPDFYVRVMK